MIRMSEKWRRRRRRGSSLVCKLPGKSLWQISAASPLRIAEMGNSGEPRVLQIAIPIFNGMTALDAIGPYNVLQSLPNVNIVFVSHSKGLCRDHVFAMEANASFDEVAIPNPLHDHISLVSKYVCIEVSIPWWICCVSWFGIQLCTTFLSILLDNNKPIGMIKFLWEFPALVASVGWFGI